MPVRASTGLGRRLRLPPQLCDAAAQRAVQWLVRTVVELTALSSEQSGLPRWREQSVVDRSKHRPPHREPLHRAAKHAKRGTRAHTIDDVAARAGVSIKTVSRVVNREPSVREETATRVRHAI